MTPKEISRLANGIFRASLPANWAVRDQQDQEDNGIDYEMELTAEHDQATGFMFKVQQKGEISVTPANDGLTVTYSGLPITKLTYYIEQIPTPVVLALVDITTKCVYWTMIQGNPQVNTAYQAAKAAGQTTTTLRIPSANVLPATVDQLLQEVAQTLDVLTLRRACTMEPARLKAASQRAEALNMAGGAAIRNVIMPATSAPDSVKTKAAQTKWSMQNTIIRDLIQTNAIEAAHTLASLLLNDPQITDATPKDLAKIENNMGCCLMRMGRLIEAESHFIRARQLVPAEGKYIENCLTARSNNQPADQELLSQVEEQLARRPDTQLEITKAQILAALQGPQAALDWIQKCITTRGPSSDLYANAARMALRVPDRRQANQFAEAGLLQSPSDPELCHVKAEALMLPYLTERDGILLPPSQPSQAQEQDIKDAVRWYKKAIEDLLTPKDQRRFQLSEVLNQRGVAYVMLGALDEALSDFDESVRQNPIDTAARFNRFTLRLRLDRDENIDTDAEYLLAEPKHRRHALRNYAAYLGEKGRIEDLENLANRYGHEFADILETGFTLALARDSNRRPYSNARRFLREWRKSHHDESTTVLRACAHVLSNMGHTSLAERMLQKAMTLSNQDASSFGVAHDLAALYSRRNKWKEACETYRKYMPISSYNPDLPAYLYAQMHADGAEAALATIKDKLHPSVREQPGVMFLWAQMERDHGHVLIAARLFLRLWRKHKSPESAVHCAHCLYRLPHTRRRAEKILRAIRNYDHMRPESAMLAAAMLADFEHYEEALAIAYSIAIRHQTNRPVQERYAALVLIQCHNRLNLLTDVAKNGHVIDVEVKGEKRCWFLSPHEGDPLLPNCEPINEAKVLTAVVGYRVGEVFEFTGRDTETVHGVLRQVRRKELKLLHEILEHVRLRPDNASMFKAIPADVQTLLAELTKYARDHAAIEQAYRENQWPITWLAAAHGRQAIEVFWAALNGQIRPLDAFPGNTQSFAKHGMLASSDTPFLMDLQALQLVARFDLVPILNQIHHRCRVCQSAVDALTRAIQAEKMSQESTQTIAGDGLGGAMIQNVPENERARYRQHLAACDAFIRSLSYGQILSEPLTRELPEAAPSVLSLPVADLIEISRARSLPVLLGDMRLSGLIRPDLQFSVRAIIDLAVRTNMLTMEKTAAVLGEMKLAGIQYVSVSEDILIASMDLLVGGKKPAAFAALFSQLSPIQSDWRVALPIMAKCVSTFAIARWLGDNERQTLVAAALTAAFGNSCQEKHLRELTALVGAHLNLAPIQLKATLQTFRIWDSMQQRTIIT